MGSSLFQSHNIAQLGGSEGVSTPNTVSGAVTGTCGHYGHESTHALLTCCAPWGELRLITPIWAANRHTCSAGLEISI